MNHTDGFILIDPSGNMRFLTQDLPDLYGKLPANLRSLLDSQGTYHLDYGVPDGSYTVAQAAEALSWLVGRNIPLASGN